MKTSAPHQISSRICKSLDCRASGDNFGRRCGWHVQWLAVAAMFVAVAPLNAANDSWTSTTSGLWGTPGNWSAGVPINTSTAQFNTGAGEQTAITLSAASVAKNLTFSNAGGAIAFTFDTSLTQNNDTLTLSTGITNSDTATQTFYNAFTLAGAQTWSATSGSMNFNGNVNLGSGANSYTLTVSAAVDSTIAGNIANGGTPAGLLTKTGAGNLTLTGNNTYTGATTVSTGTLTAGSSTALGAATSVTTVASGASLAVTNGISLSNGLSVKGVGVSANVGAVSNSAGTNTITGNIAQTAATTYSAAAGTQLTLAGNTTGNFVATYGKGTANGTIVLTGTNSYTANTSVAFGTVIDGSAGGLGTGTTTVASGATLGFQSGITDNQAIGISGAGMSGSAGALESFSGTNITSGTVTLNAASTIGAITNQQLNVNGTLALGTKALTIGTSPGAGTVDIAGQITGSGTITDAFGTAVLSNSTNSYSGLTTINSGATLVAAANGALGTTAAGTTVNSGGTLGFQGGINYATAEAVTLNGAGVGSNGAMQNVSGTNTFAGNVALGSASTIGAAAGSQLNLSGTIGLGSGNNLTFGSASSTGKVNTTGIISGTGNITAAGGTTVLGNASNSYTGTNQVNSGATLQVGSSGALGNAANGVSLSGGTLQASSAFTLAATHGITLVNGGGGGTIDTQANNVTVAGVISGTGTDAFTKLGSGTLTLSGANTYSGATNVNGGILAMGASNALNNAALLTINSGTFSLLTFSETVGALAGSGTLNFGTSGALTLSSGSGTFSGTMSGSGTLTIGTGATLTLGAGQNDSNLNLILNGGSLFLNGTTSTLGNLTLNGNSIIDFGSPSATTFNISNLNLNGYTLTVEDWTKALDFMYSQTFTGATHDARGTAPENQITFNGYTNNDSVWQSIDNQVTAAPEPAAYGAIFVSLSLGIIGYVGRRRLRVAA